MEWQSVWLALRKQAYVHISVLEPFVYKAFAAVDLIKIT